MIGADRLNTLPPRSSTKWLCVATKAKVIERGVRYFSGTHRYHPHQSSPFCFLVLPPKETMFSKGVRCCQRWRNQPECSSRGIKAKDDKYGANAA